MPRSRIFRYISTATLCILFLLLEWNQVIYCRYKLIDPNEEVQIIDVPNDILTYQELLASLNLPKAPTLIYTNTRMSYDLLNRNEKSIAQIQSAFSEMQLNFVFTAQGLENELSNKRDWYIRMKDSKLSGLHVSLSDDFQDYLPLWKETKDEGKTISHFPNLLLMNEDFEKVDTVYGLKEEGPELLSLFKNLEKITTSNKR